VAFVVYAINKIAEQALNTPATAIFGMFSDKYVSDLLCMTE
jgi:hypothetical protein